MPTVLREGGFAFIIYTDDHEPAHTHVFKSDDEVIINLGGKKEKPWGRDNFGMKNAEERKALKITNEHQDYLLKKWKEIHG